MAFTEARYSKLLRQPLVVSGELTYLGAASLDRRVTSPYGETTTIRGNTVRIEREGQAARSFALERVPQLEGFLTAFGHCLPATLRRSKGPSPLRRTATKPEIGRSTLRRSMRVLGAT